jgi:AcrR family transcriptional regulator
MHARGHATLEDGGGPDTMAPRTPPGQRPQPRASERPAPDRSRDRRAKGLSREVVIAAARQIAAKGVGNLTMNSLAEELDVTPMALYRYVGGKRELVGHLVDSIMGEIDVPGPDEGPWDQRLRTLQLRIIDAVVAHPGLNEVVFSGTAGVHGIRLLQGGLEILRDAGFDDEESVKAALTLMYLRMGAMQGAGRSAGVAEMLLGDEAASAAEIHAESERAIRELAVDTMIAGLRLRLEAGTP